MQRNNERKYRAEVVDVPEERRPVRSQFDLISVSSQEKSDVSRDYVTDVLDRLLWLCDYVVLFDKGGGLAFPKCQIFSNKGKQPCFSKLHSLILLCTFMGAVEQADNIVNGHLTNRSPTFTPLLDLFSVCTIYVCKLIATVVGHAIWRIAACNGWK